MAHNNASIHKSQPYLVHCSRRTPRFFGLSWTSLEQNLPLPEMLVQYWSYLACFPPTTDACDFNAAPNVRKPATSSPALPVLTLLFFFCGVFFLTSTKILRFLKRIRFFRRPLTLSDYLILGVPTNIFPRSSKPRLCLSQKGVGIRKVWIQYTVYLLPLPYTLLAGCIVSLSLTSVSRPTVVTGGGKQSRGTTQSCPPVEMNVT